MTAEDRPGDDAACEQPRWLTSAEMEAWLALIGMVTLLPQALDRQLRDDAGINHIALQILAMLSEADGRQQPMSHLASETGLSLSRLSHAVRSLERQGWVTRRQSTDDRRVQIASLTEEGMAFLELAAPGHVAAVRRHVFDHLDGADVAALSRIAGKVAAHLGSAPGVG